MSYAKHTSRFWSARAGDTITVQTRKERDDIMSSFRQWAKSIKAPFAAKSRKADAGYLITFSGQHPNEALTARNAAAHGSDEI